jgi:hypothetical protein
VRVRGVVDILNKACPPVTQADQNIEEIMRLYATLSLGELRSTKAKIIAEANKHYCEYECLHHFFRGRDPKLNQLYARLADRDPELERYRHFFIK